MSEDLQGHATPARTPPENGSWYGQEAPLTGFGFNDPEYDPFVLGIPPVMVRGFVRAMIEAGQSPADAIPLAKCLRTLFLKRHALLALN